MANHISAPALYQKGKELWKTDAAGKLIIDNNIVYALYKATGAKSKTQFGLMMFFLGCAQDGRFSIPAKEVEKRMGIGDKTYYKGLGELVKLGLIDWEKEKNITIRYDNLWKLIYGADDSTNGEYSTSVEYSTDEDSTDGEYSTLVELLKPSTDGECSTNSEYSTDGEYSTDVDYLKMF